MNGRLRSHKTKAFRETLGKLDGEARTILLVENEPNVNLERASRNLDGVTLVPTSKRRAVRSDAPRAPDAFARSGAAD